ncbi:hypothetical protein HQ531_05185 [bacterium]|nr:hypothetical protein [bacterium]
MIETYIRSIKPVLWIAALLIAKSTVFGQYEVGETINQETRERTVFYCANAEGSEPLGDLLNPAEGELNRVLWINFFGSW